MRPNFEKRTLVLRDEQVRDRALAVIRNLPIDAERPLRIVIDDPLPAQSRDVQKKYHAQIGDIARHLEHAGRKWEAEDMKRILIDQFQRDMMKDPDIGPLWAACGQLRMAPALDGSGVVVLNASSRRFSARLASCFVEWLTALGTELGVEWSES